MVEEKTRDKLGIVEVMLDESEVGSGKSEVIHGKTFFFNKNVNLFNPQSKDCLE